MENGGKTIKKIKLYKCGYCVNNLKHILKNSKSKIIKFPALVVYIEHSKYGNILFDTGYSKRIYNNGIISKIYNLVNKTYVTQNDTIKNKLMKDKIKKIDKIILSHSHPDHIGGLQEFKNYELISTNEVFESLKKHKITDLVFKNMLPLENIKKVEILKKSKNHFFYKYFDKVFDVFGDGSIIAVPLEGHTKGQIGIYIDEFKLLFAADSSWGNMFINNIDNMKFLPKMLQYNFEEYKKTVRKLKQINDDVPEIQIIFSHENLEEKIYE